MNTTYEKRGMGKKTSKRKPPAKKQRGKVDTEFTCPFCNHDKSCIVTLYVHNDTSEDKKDVPSTDRMSHSLCSP